MTAEIATRIEDAFEADTALANHDVDTKHVVILALPHAVDFTIHSGNRSWGVHKATLCKRSIYFNLACNGPFQEATQDQMTLHEDDPSAVHDMLTYLMYDSYGPAFVHSPLETHIATHDIADKYLLPDLQNLAVLNFTDRVKSAWPKGTAYDPTSAFAAAVEMVYGNKYANELRKHRLKQALRITATVRLVQALANCWQQRWWKTEPPTLELARWGNVGGTFAEPDAPEFMADFWGNGKLYGWWFQAGFPGMRYVDEEGELGQEGSVGCWVYEE
jgi:hypothetical protein